MVREGWNFKNDIAMRLEFFARRFYRCTDRPYGKIYDSDSIEMGTFVEVMIIMVRQKIDFSCENDDVEQFVDRCAPYFSKSGHDIEPEIANELFDEFFTLMGEI